MIKNEVWKLALHQQLQKSLKEVKKLLKCQKKKKTKHLIGITDPLGKKNLLMKIMCYE